jgi:protoporphyrinogen oxidase
MGPQAYDVIWKPMIEGKFGAHYKDVNLAWFWARVYKRTQRLGYYRGGFQAFVDGLAERVRDQGAEMRLGARIESIRSNEHGIRLQVVGEPPRDFDAVLSTTSPGLMQRLAPDMPESYLGRLRELKSMGAVVLTIALDRPLMKDVYWANIPKREGLPFLGLVEHTNMVDPAHYGGDHLLYIGDYLDLGHRYFDMSAEELLAEFQPHLVKFNPDFRPDWIKGAWVHKAPYAQPVPPVGYLEMIPDVRTPVRGLYFASMSQVYPWDRGTNFAVEMGRKVAAMVQEDIRNGQIQPARAGELLENR